MKQLPEWFNLGWAIVVCVVGVAFCLGNLLESPSTHESRVRSIMAPVEQRLEHCQSTLTELKAEFKHHRELGGHPQMEARMQTVEQSLSIIQADIKTILQKLD